MIHAVEIELLMLEESKLTDFRDMEGSMLKREWVK